MRVERFTAAHEIGHDFTLAHPDGSPLLFHDARHLMRRKSTPVRGFELQKRSVKSRANRFEQRLACLPQRRRHIRRPHANNRWAGHIMKPLVHAITGIFQIRCAFGIVCPHPVADHDACLIGDDLHA